jgi:hypothetical protein
MEEKSYEDKSETIDREINKRRSKWQLKAIAWMDFEDVRQLLRIHIYKKWSLWDQSRPIEPWLNAIITNQMNNLIRDNLWSFSRPCLRCDANQGGDLCGIYTEQCCKCPLYLKWYKKKKKVHDLKIPTSYHDERNNTDNSTFFLEKDTFIDYDVSIEKIHLEMENRLKPSQYLIYKMLFIECLSEDDVAKKCKYKADKYNKKRKYKPIENHKKKFMEVAREIILDEGI